MRRFKVFVSSPSDVDHERRRVEQVVERLNGEFAGAAQLETFRWEARYYRAHATFQAQIPEAAECDIVVAIFHARLGTELPLDYKRLPDGQPYPSGAAYEVLSAIEARQRRGDLPDVFVFRRPQPPTVALDNIEAYQQAKEQWERVKAFFETWFLAPQGPFKLAFHHFCSTDDFGAQFEKLLRQWLDEKVLRSRTVLWPTEIKGSPFRGLAAFGAKHAPVFFGRSRDISRAADGLKQAAERGTPFLLIVGASGSGKSSLARAGIVPRLTTPGVVPSIDVWRVAAMRPTELPGGPVATLATRLMEAAVDIGEEDAGRPPALPEIMESDFQSPGELAALLAHAGAAVSAPILRALHRVGEAQRGREGYERSLRTDLLLVVDQLDELFGPDVDEEERARFTRILARLTGTRRIWLIVTLRADLYERFLSDPELLALKTTGATYDLAPPGPAELAEIVRKPAEAAGLHFETDPASSERLDERLLRDAERPDMLPLLQLALNRLFEARTVVEDEIRLTVAAYDALGRLAGVINHEAERAVAELGEDDLARLPRLLRQLAAFSRDKRDGGTGTLTIRTVPLAAATPDDSSRRLVRALVEARILLCAGEGEGAGLHLVHQRVLADWIRARDLVAANAEFYRIRDEIEDQRDRWEAAGKRRELLIPQGLPLAEAEMVAAQFGAELPRETDAFIKASGHAARRRRRFTTTAATLFALLAIVATSGGTFAWLEAQKAVLERQNTVLERARSFEERGLSALAENDPASAEVLLTRALILHDRPEVRQLLIQARARSPELRWVSPHPGASVLAISHDGKSFALQTGSRIEIWDAQQRARTRDFPHKGKVESAAFSFDGRMLAASMGTVVALWNLQPIEIAARPVETGIRGDIQSLAFSRDGRELAFGSSNRTVCIMRIEQPAQAPRCSTTRHTDKITALAFSPDGRKLVSGSWDNDLKLWDATALQELRPLHGHLDAVLSVAFSDDGTRIASGSWDNTIRIWDSETNRPPLILQGHKGGVVDLTFSSDGMLLASGSEDGTARLWQVETGRTLLAFRGSDEQVGHVALMGNSTWPKVIAGNTRGEIRLWDAYSQRSELTTLRGHQKPVSALDFAPSGSLVATGSWDETVRLWDTSSGAGRVFDRHDAHVTAVAISPDGQWVASADKVSVVHIRNISSNELRVLKTEDGAAKEPVRKVAFSPDGKRLAAAGDDGQIRIWDTATAALIRHYPAHPGPDPAHPVGILGLAFSPNGKLLASSDRKGEIQLWETAEWTRSHSPKGHEKGVWQVVFSPDGRYLLSASDDRTARLWDVASGTLVGRPLEHKAAVWSVDFSPDGRVLATGDEDSTVQLWDVLKNGDRPQLKQSLLLRVCDGPVWWIQFSRAHNSRTLGIAGEDSTVRIWDGQEFNRSTSTPRSMEEEANRHTGLHISEKEPGLPVVPLAPGA